jgi:hypothetical protein
VVVPSTAISAERVRAKDTRWPPSSTTSTDAARAYVYIDRRYVRAADRHVLAHDLDPTKEKPVSAMSHRVSAARRR